jgi:hypothetical protein
LAVGFFDRQFGALEADAAVGAIAEGFVDRTAATAERERGLAGEVVWGAVGVNEFDGTFWSFHAEWAIGTYCDFDLSHEYSFLQPYRFTARIKR